MRAYPWSSYRPDGDLCCATSAVYGTLAGTQRSGLPIDVLGHCIPAGTLPPGVVGGHL